MNALEAEDKMVLESAAQELADCLSWITKCCYIAGPANTKAYVISDAMMNRAKKVIALVEGEP